MGFVTRGTTVRIRISRAPNPAEADLDGYDLRRFQAAQTYDAGPPYDVGPRLAEYLMLSGSADFLETRQVDRAAAKSAKGRA